MTNFDGDALHATALRMLAVLMAEPRPWSYRELMPRLGLSRGQVANLARLLHAAGLARREPRKARTLRACCRFEWRPTRRPAVG